MANGAHHYAAAEKLLASITDARGGWATITAAMAAVHAQLALVAITYDSAYEVGGPDARAWDAAVHPDSPRALRGRNGGRPGR